MLKYIGNEKFRGGFIPIEWMLIEKYKAIPNVMLSPFSFHFFLGFEIAPRTSEILLFGTPRILVYVGYKPL